MSVGMINTDHVTSLVDCINSCVLSPVCDSLNFRSSDMSCQVVGHVNQLTVSSADIVADAQWQWWRPTYTVVVYQIKSNQIFF